MSALQSAMTDQALHRGLTTRDRLAAVADAKSGHPGAGRARRLFEFADGRSESVGESITRVQLRQLGLPPPDLQHEVVGADGRVVARADFCFVELGVVVEFDGRVKYERLLRPGESSADVVYREKRREDAIRALGLGVVRLVWRDHSADATVLDQCAAAFARQGHRGWRPGAPGLVGWRARLQ